MTDFVTLDVRPAMQAGREPFSLIMAALEGLAPGQGLRLKVGFEPVPLYGVMAARGFSAAPQPLPRGDWEVLFAPAGDAADAVAPPQAAASGCAAPALELDNRGLAPPEPMMRILAALAGVPEGAVLTALLDREPVFLFPELERRGHSWQGGFRGDGVYALTVRAGAETLR
jgi:uncharacterized protein (DUF2249 family)